MRKRTPFPIIYLLVILIFVSLACNLTSYRNPGNPPVVEQPATAPIENPTQETLPTEEPLATNPPEPSATPKVARTVSLTPDGGGEYLTLQAAVEDLADGSTILLAAGTYRIEETLQIKKSLTIKGAGHEETTLFGSSGQLLGVFQFVGPGKIVLEGITFTYTGTETGQTAGIKDAEFHIQDCRFTSQEGLQPEKGGIGLLISGISTGTIVKSRFDNNKINGLTLMDESYVEVEFSEFISNGNFGMAFMGTSSGSAINCTASNNQSIGFGTTDQAVVSFESNVASENAEFGFYARGESFMKIYYNSVYDNRSSGIHVIENASADIVGNAVFKNEEAGIALVGEATDLNVSENQVFSNKMSGIAVEKNTIATVTDNEVYDNAEAGISVLQNTQVTATQNLIYANKLSGIILQNNGYATIEDNEINDNKQAAIVFFHSSSGVVRGNLCSGNLAGIENQTDQKLTIGENNCQ